MAKRLMVGKIEKGVFVNGAGYVGDKLVGTEGLKAELGIKDEVVVQAEEVVVPVVEESVVEKAQQYDFFDDPDTRRMIAAINENRRRHLAAQRALERESRERAFAQEHPVRYAIGKLIKKVSK
jgi:hypothetical protein